MSFSVGGPKLGGGTSRFVLVSGGTWQRLGSLVLAVSCVVHDTFHVLA